LPQAGASGRTLAGHVCSMEFGRAPPAMPVGVIVRRSGAVDQPIGQLESWHRIVSFPSLGDDEAGRHAALHRAL